MWPKKLRKNDVFIIGDTLLDILAARKAGFKSVAVATGRRTLEELDEGRPDILLSDLTEGETILKKNQ